MLEDHGIRIATADRLDARDQLVTAFARTLVLPFVLSLVGVVVLGVSAVSDYNAKPATVSEAIDIKASAFKLDDDAAEGAGDDAAHFAHAHHAQRAVAQFLSHELRALVPAAFARLALDLRSRSARPR